MNDQINITFAKNSELSADLRNEIIAIKEQYWKYTFSEHLEWMNENLRENDIHIILYINSEIAGYANLVYRDFLNKEKIKIMGVGNVCVSQKQENKGVGMLVMNSIQFFLKSRNLIGLLFCKEALINFYVKSGWKEYTGVMYDNSARKIVHKSLFINGLLDSETTLLDKLF